MFDLGTKARLRSKVGLRFDRVFEGEALLFASDCNSAFFSKHVSFQSEVKAAGASWKRVHSFKIQEDHFILEIFLGFARHERSIQTWAFSRVTVIVLVTVPVHSKSS